MARRRPRGLYQSTQTHDQQDALKPFIFADRAAPFRLARLSVQVRGDAPTPASPSAPCSGLGPGSCSPARAAAHLPQQPPIAVATAAAVVAAIDVVAATIAAAVAAVFAVALCRVSGCPKTPSGVFWRRSRRR